MKLRRIAALAAASVMTLAMTGCQIITIDGETPVNTDGGLVGSGSVGIHTEQPLLCKPG